MRVVLLKRKLTSFQIIIIGFSGVIIFGTFLLMLPFSSRSGLATPFFEALFTSTSAVCVTGLIIHDTATYWSVFGQIVILLLIQIGGMGVITVAASFAMISGRKISLMQRSTMQEAISAPKVGGIVRLTGFIVRGTLVMELLCAAVMAPVFCRDFGKKGLWMALFHSVSAFCNAGFDLLGVRTPFSSLTSYAANPVINFTIMFLIVVGGIGFLTWDDIRANRLHLRKYRMQSKVILCTTAVLLIVPAMYFYFFEFDDLTRKERLLSSLFQAVTPRTAGFNTVELTDLSEAGQFITIALMLIGGSPGSTAGGLKNATTISLMYITLCCTGGLIISVSEGLPMITCLFETASAVGTVGLSLGITPELKLLSRVVLILLMFFGRVGGLTLIFAALSGVQKKVSKLPKEKITVG